MVTLITLLHLGESIESISPTWSKNLDTQEVTDLAVTLCLNSKKWACMSMYASIMHVSLA